MRLAPLLAAATLTLASGAASAQAPAPKAPAAPAASAARFPTPPASAAPKDDGQWTMPEKNDAASRFSALNQINTTNVKKPSGLSHFSQGVEKGEEVAPIVVNNTMYLVTAYPNIVYALDLTKPGAPLKWDYKPWPNSASQGVACCDVVNRGGDYADGKFVFNTLDGNTIALDANSGQLLWKTKLA